MNYVEKLFADETGKNEIPGQQEMEEKMEEIGLEGFRVSWVIGEGWKVVRRQTLWLDDEDLRKHFIKNNREDLVEALEHLQNIKLMEENYSKPTDRRFELWYSSDVEFSDIYIEISEENPSRTEEQSKSRFFEVLEAIGWVSEKEQIRLKELFSPSEAQQYMEDLYTRYDKEKDGSFKKIAEYLYGKATIIKNEYEKQLEEIKR